MVDESLNGENGSLKIHPSNSQISEDIDIEELLIVTERNLLIVSTFSRMMNKMIPEPITVTLEHYSTVCLPQKFFLYER